MLGVSEKDWTGIDMLGGPHMDTQDLFSIQTAHVTSSQTALNSTSTRVFA